MLGITSIKREREREKRKKGGRGVGTNSQHHLGTLLAMCILGPHHRPAESGTPEVELSTLCFSKLPSYFGSMQKVEIHYLKYKIR